MKTLLHLLEPTVARKWPLVTHLRPCSLRLPLL